MCTQIYICDIPLICKPEGNGAKEQNIAVGNDANVDVIKH